MRIFGESEIGRSGFGREETVAKVLLHRTVHSPGPPAFNGEGADLGGNLVMAGENAIFQDVAISWSATFARSSSALD